MAETSIRPQSPVAFADVALVRPHGITKHPVRWVMLAMIAVIDVIVFLDKGSMSVVAPSIAKEFDLSKAEVGVIFSVFIVGTGLGQIPGGWLSDRFGPRRILASLLAIWSTMMILTGMGVGFLSLCLGRFFTALPEGGAFPSGTRAVRRWFPPTELGFVLAIPNVCARLGGALVPALGVAIILYLGWRGVFYVFGAVGVLWAALYYAVYRNSPEEHSWVVGGALARQAPPSLAGVPVPWMKILRTSTMWGLFVGGAAYSYSIYFYTTWLPTYLIQYHHLSLVEMAPYATWIFIAGMVGGVAGGLLTDRILVVTKNLSRARRFVAAAACLASAATLVPAALAESVFVASLLMSASMFFLEMTTGPCWAVCVDVGGDMAGTIGGMMNCVSNLVAATSPIVFGFLVASGHWVAPFPITAGVLVAGAAAWIFLIKPNRSIIADQKAHVG